MTSAKGRPSWADCPEVMGKILVNDVTGEAKPEIAERHTQRARTNSVLGSLRSNPLANLLDHLVVKFVLGKEGCRVVLNEIKLAEGRLKLPNSKIVQAPKQRKDRATTVNNIAVLDSAPLKKTLV